MAKQDEWVRLTVRLPPEVYGRLADAVAGGPNSMNAEIVARLVSTFDAKPSLAPLGSLPPNELDRIAQAAAARAAVDAIDAVLQALALPDGTPNAERFKALLGDSTERWLARSAEAEE